MTEEELVKIESYWGKRGPHDLYRLLAEVRRLWEELDKAKADLGARNRILTEEP